MDRLAQTCEEVARNSSRLKKIAVMAAYLQPLSDADLARAVRFLSSGPIISSDRKFSVGGSILRQAAIAVTGWDQDIYSLCYREVGDTGETIGLLLPGRTEGRVMSLADAEIYYARLYKMPRAADKAELLKEIFASHLPTTIKYFVKMITGNLRIGLQAKMVEEAVASATGVPHEKIRQANNRLGDLAQIALAARHGNLHQIEARLFHPMDFMLARPLEDLDGLRDPENYYIEDKYDGIRSQAHVENKRVMLFSRGMEEVTNGFPEIVAAMKTLPGSAVLDGEILAWRDGHAMAFTVLQQRIARKKVAAAMMEAIPVVFMAYDVLYYNGRMLVDAPVEERRAILETLLHDCLSPLLLSPQAHAETTEDIDRAFAQARADGNEGLLLKRRASVYEPGRRTGAWWKLKRPYGTLDVVVTAAEQGHGRRAASLSDYTFAVRSGEKFVNVGKAYSGLTDQEIRDLTRILRAATLERFGRVSLVRPEVVLEVAFDGVQKSARHKSGYALRFPRILRWRADKTVAECDDLARVKELYEASLRGPHPGQA
ncbi:MAG TPA: cisplatin damage response ATP-dependent DNA ligase [Bryobacteraceae bacterium]|nr:cisplatin damage response ATP-dependent DNA ligase [Bryobacteraceae bacterium]